MNVLVTGCAGFIGANVSQKLLERGDTVYGIDNLNDYYDVNLKLARLEQIKGHDSFIFNQFDITNYDEITSLFKDYKIDRVIHLAAQAGVRYSLENPFAYIDANIQGFINILEVCRHFNVGHLVFASSSSVYGANTSMPFSIHDNIDHPLSLYAATKKSNELMAHTYTISINCQQQDCAFLQFMGHGAGRICLFLCLPKALLKETPSMFSIMVIMHVISLILMISFLVWLVFAIRLRRATK